MLYYGLLGHFQEIQTVTVQCSVTDNLRRSYHTILDYGMLGFYIRLILVSNKQNAVTCYCLDRFNMKNLLWNWLITYYTSNPDDLPLY